MPKVIKPRTLKAAIKVMAPGVFKAVVVKDDKIALRCLGAEPSRATPYHKHNFPHMGVVMRGNGFVKEDGKKYAVETDDVFYVPANVAHSFIAGNEGLEFICVVSAENEPD